MKFLITALQKIITAEVPTADKPPKNIAAMIQLCKTKNKPELASKVMEQWTKVLSKYPKTRIYMDIAVNIGTASIRKNVFLGKSFADWLGENLTEPLSPEELKMAKEADKTVPEVAADTPAIAIPKKGETPEDWKVAAAKTQEVLGQAKAEFHNVEEFLSFLRMEVGDIKRKIDTYGPGGTKEKTSKGDPSEMSKRVPKWQTQLEVYEKQLQEVEKEVAESKAGLAIATEKYGTAKAVTVAFEEKVQENLEEAIDRMTDIITMEISKKILEQLKQSVEEVEKATAKIKITADFASILNSLKSFWNGLVKWAKNLHKSVNKLNSLLDSVQ